MSYFVAVGTKKPHNSAIKPAPGLYGSDRMCTKYGRESTEGICIFSQKLLGSHAPNNMGKHSVNGPGQFWLQ